MASGEHPPSAMRGADARERAFFRWRKAPGGPERADVGLVKPRAARLAWGPQGPKQVYHKHVMKVLVVAAAGSTPPGLSGSSGLGPAARHAAGPATPRRCRCRLLGGGGRTDGRHDEHDEEGVEDLRGPPARHSLWGAAASGATVRRAGPV